jgi:predicted nuclease of predicted toxin-antitoxin system
LLDGFALSAMKLCTQPRLGCIRISDNRILDVARAEGRVVVTADLDFPRLLATLGVTGPGLILLRGGNHNERESLDCLRRVLLAVPERDLPRAIVVVDREKIRRRRWLLM